MEQRPDYIYFKDEKEDTLSQKLFVRFVVIFFVVYIFIASIGFVFYSNFSYITISGKSMQTTLNPNPVLVETEQGSDYLQDGVYIKLTKDVGYGDIVVLNTSLKSEEKVTIIKRVLGLEGDYVSIIKIAGKGNNPEYRVLRKSENSSRVEVIEEDYVKSYADWSGEIGDVNELRIDGVVYESKFYMNFKNTFNYESKTFPVKELGGEEVIFFKVPENSIFFLGDNRTNSNDSRSQDYGCLKLSRIEGKVVDVVRDGSKYKGNNLWWINRAQGFFRVIWQEILCFFGYNG